MLLLPYLATILMVATLGHVAGEEKLAIALLADFETNILIHVKAFCRQMENEEELKEIRATIRKSPLSQKTQVELINSMFCESVKALENTWEEFEGKIIKRMGIGETYQHLIFSAIQTRGLLDYPGVMPGIISDYPEFVTKVKQIVGTMTDYLHRHNFGYLNAKAKGEVNAEVENKIGIINQIGKTKKLELLKGLFLDKVTEMSKTRVLDKVKEMSKPLGPYEADPEWKCMHGLQRVLTEIHKYSDGEDGKKQLKFTLALFVANFKYVKVFQKGQTKINMEFANNWNHQMTLKALNEN